MQKETPPEIRSSWTRPRGGPRATGAARCSADGMKPQLFVRSCVMIGFAALLLGGSTVRAEATPRPQRFDENAAWSFLVRQVQIGPRPAGSPASRHLADLLRTSIPHGRFQ